MENSYWLKQRSITELFMNSFGKIHSPMPLIHIHTVYTHTTHKHMLYTHIHMSHIAHIHMVYTNTAHIYTFWKSRKLLRVFPMYSVKVAFPLCSSTLLLRIWMARLNKRLYPSKSCTLSFHVVQLRMDDAL